jgi:hypothetical protein
MININDLHWAAAFMDGEGSFGTHTHRQQSPQLLLSASQKYTWSLEKLQRIFGYGRIRYRARKDGRYIWTWEVNSRRAAAIMMTLYSLMSPYRKAQIENALKTWRSVPHKRRGRPGGSPRGEGFLQRDESLWNTS